MKLSGDWDCDGGIGVEMDRRVNVERPVRVRASRGIWAVRWASTSLLWTPGGCVGWEQKSSSIDFAGEAVLFDSVGYCNPAVREVVYVNLLITKVWSSRSRSGSGRSWCRAVVRLSPMHGRKCV